MNRTLICHVSELSRAELVAMGFVAFVAGYHTTGTLLTFLSYILATHPEVQDRLAAEIDAKYTSVSSILQY